MGPLSGLKVVEMAGIGPAPFAGMLLSDMGADVIRIDRKAPGKGDAFDAVKGGGFLDRGRRSIALDLKKPEAVAAALELIGAADALIEGFRPGVMERLGLGPDVCLARNPRLVFGRVTGWGQSGPLAQTAGHDIDYIALTGALHAIGERSAPTPPLNLLGDFGGGAMALAFGVVCALLEAKSSGRGQVVDAAMTDGVALLMAMTYSLKAKGIWRDQRQRQPARRRRALLRRLSLRRRQVSRRRRAGAAILRRAGRRDGARRARFRRPLGSCDVAGYARGSGGRLRPADARRMGGDLRRDGRLRRADPRHGRSAASSPQRRARDLSRARRRARSRRPRRDSRAPRRRSPARLRAQGEHGEEILSERGFTSERIDALKRAGAL